MDIQAITDIAKPVIAIVATLFIPYLKRNSTYSLGRKSKALAEMEFLTSFLAFDITQRPRIIIEQAFAIHFKCRFDFEQIQLLLNFKNPYRAFQLLLRSREYLELKDNSEFAYKKGFKTEAERKRKIWLNYLGYFVFIYPVILVLFDISKFFKDLNHFDTLVFSFFLLVFAAIAIGCFLKTREIEYAQMFMLEQEKTKKAQLKD